MDITGNQKLVIRAMPVASQQCTREQAKELLERLRAAYESLLPAERI